MAHDLGTQTPRRLFRRYLISGESQALEAMQRNFGVKKLFFEQHNSFEAAAKDTQRKMKNLSFSTQKVSFFLVSPGSRINQLKAAVHGRNQAGALRGDHHPEA